MTKVIVLLDQLGQVLSRIHRRVHFTRGEEGCNQRMIMLQYRIKLLQFAKGCFHWRKMDLINHPCCETQGTIVQGLCVLTSQVSSVGGYHDEGEEPSHARPHSCEIQGTIVQGLYVLTSQVSSVGRYHDEGEEPPHACPHFVRSREQ
jgi:hypothetical protein